MGRILFTVQIFKEQHIIFLSSIAAFAMTFLFGMKLHNYLAVSTSTSVIVDKSSDGDYLWIDFNISLPALSCEFASVDVSDVLGTNRLNIAKTVRKYSIDKHLLTTGSEFYSGLVTLVFLLKCTRLRSQCWKYL
ncbi:hypothetical protein L6452_05826 [Arctium lappa]|uniref:Uncharacterized protein n=1 Tax=Arctium lappa TaxID=4217 RepID=A0ACB9EH52_ARCLA|nr:hypothetical protein L6452_05826 [Arctium lappa]